MHSALPIAPRRIHLTRLMSIWRSAGWPCRDAVELDLVAAGWAMLVEGADGHDSIRLTDAGIRLLAQFPAAQPAVPERPRSTGGQGRCPPDGRGKDRVA